jgi:dTDP-glucose pyrophosphorylase/CBS domain-containing protein
MKYSKNKDDLSISDDTKVIDALKLMDTIKRKLLIVTKQGSFYSMLSIGDLQRAIIQGVSLNESVENILRPKEKITIAQPYDSIETIKQNILEHKAEFMPVVDENGTILRLYFWDEVIGLSQSVEDDSLNIPLVLMAGGKGTRLKPLTNIIPKALVPIGDKPIMENIIEKFYQAGIHKYYVTLYHKGEMIQQYFDQLPNKKYELEYIYEVEPLGTAGSLHYLKNTIQSTFFVTNCDVLIDQDYREVYRYHKENQNEMTLVSALMHYSIPYGTIETGKDGILKDIDEKPELTYQVNTGMYILEPHLLREIPDHEFFHITSLIHKIQQRRGKIGVFPVSQKSWLDIGVWKKYEDSINEFKNWINF